MLQCNDLMFTWKQTKCYNDVWPADLYSVHVTAAVQYSTVLYSVYSAQGRGLNTWSECSECEGLFQMLIFTQCPAATSDNSKQGQ